MFSLLWTYGVPSTLLCLSLRDATPPIASSVVDSKRNNGSSSSSNSSNSSNSSSSDVNESDELDDDDDVTSRSSNDRVASSTALLALLRALDRVAHMHPAYEQRLLRCCCWFFCCLSLHCLVSDRCCHRRTSFVRSYFVHVVNMPRFSLVLPPTTAPSLNTAVAPAVRSFFSLVFFCCMFLWSMNTYF